MRTFSYDFRQGAQEWVADAARYWTSYAVIIEEYRPLQGALASQGSALFVQGTASPVPFMFYKRKLIGLTPGVTYAVSFVIEIATNTPTGCLGFGASPGDETYIKGGATTAEPTTFEQASTLGPYVVGSFNPGVRTSGGPDALVLGNIANSRPCPDYSVWELKTVQSSSSLAVTAGVGGEAWVFQAVDPGFEGRISLYFTRFTATFRPQ